MVHIDIEARPAEAVILLDGKELARGHYAETQRPDDEAHELVVQAPGYQADRQEIRFDKTVQLVIALHQTVGETAPPAQPRTGGAKAAQPKEPAPAGSGAEPTGVSGKPGKPKKRKLDSDDPWAD